MNITIDPAVIDLISAEAERQERSRSWIIEWAVKKTLGEGFGPAHQDRQTITAAQAEAMARYALPATFGQPTPGDQE